MRIGIIGCGVVGEATARALEARGHAVERHDPDKGLYARGFDVAFVCVPTPLNTNSEQLGTHVLIEAMRATEAALYVVRSTTPVGGCDALASVPLVYMPCFAREDYAAEEEAQVQHRIYGGEREAVELVAKLFGDPYTRTDFRTAEFIKLALNAKLATDISFATEMGAAARGFGVEWDTVAEVLKRDPRIGKDAYLRPGPFGGKCLPKDTQNLQTQTGSMLLKAVLEVNDGHHHESKPEKEYTYAAG